MQHGNPSPHDVAQAASRLGRTLSDPEAKGLAAYLGLLETWNRKMNLVGPSHWQEMLTELVADSWHLADLLADLAKCGPGLPPAPVTFDFGAGAGIPGVPLRLFWDAGQYLLIEPRAKRTGFLRQCLAEMRLPGTRVFEGRAEALAGQRADICLSRAFQPWRDFLETARTFWRETGQTASAPSSIDCSDQATTTKGFPGLAILFANDPQPEGPLPEGYSLVTAKAYPCRGKTGYFWVFSPIAAC